MERKSHLTLRNQAKSRGMTIRSFLILLVAISAVAILAVNQFDWISPAQGEGNETITATRDNHFDLRDQRDRHLARHVARTYGTPVQAPLYGLSHSQIASLPREQLEACQRVMMDNLD
ncbi:MAG: hypothetical protein KC994_20940 [Candidatus Omnitrophica bacterium]|nr:hypothetical protein [Candidatus Omnitrophota bacterium]